MSDESIPVKSYTDNSSQTQPFVNNVHNLFADNVNGESTKTESANDKSGAQPAGNALFAYNIQEWILIKSFTFSMLAVIIIVVLTVVLLNLVGGYLPVIALSLLTSIALRPTKDSISASIKGHFGVDRSKDRVTNYLNRAVILHIIKFVNKVYIDYSTGKLELKSTTKITKFYQKITPTSNVYAISMLCFVYILISRFGLGTTFFIFLALVFADLIIRATFDGMTILINQFEFTKNLKRNIQSSTDMSDNIESLVTTLVIVCFLLLSLICIVLIIVMIFMDLESILLNLKTSTMTLVKTVNDGVAVKFGVENVIDEKFVRSFLNNYNESIYSYIPNDDLKALYLSFSGNYIRILNSLSHRIFQ